MGMNNAMQLTITKEITLIWTLPHENVMVDQLAKQATSSHFYGL